MEPSGPVNGYLRGLFVELEGASHRVAGRQLAKLVQAVKHGAVLPHVEELDHFSLKAK